MGFSVKEIACSIIKEMNTPTHRHEREISRAPVAPTHGTLRLSLILKLIVTGTVGRPRGQLADDVGRAPCHQAWVPFLSSATSCAEDLTFLNSSVSAPVKRKRNQRRLSAFGLNI